MEGVEVTNVNPNAAADMASMQPEELPERRDVSIEEVHAKLDELIELPGYDKTRDLLSVQTFPRPSPPLPSPSLCACNFHNLTSLHTRTLERRPVSMLRRAHARNPGSGPMLSSQHHGHRGRHPAPRTALAGR